MATVRELSALYENFMLSPRLGRGVCVRCLNLTDGYEECYACSRTPPVLAAMAAVSYSVAHEQLHHTLSRYKRLTGEAARRMTLGLAAVLWRYLELHEECLARAAGVENFPVVTVVPPSTPRTDDRHPLTSIVAELVLPTRERYAPLLERTHVPVAPREFSLEKYASGRPLQGHPVLLIDDTWTTGASAQSAAAALRAAGSGPVAGVVIGRHVNRAWRENDRQLKALQPFDWSACALCARAEAVL